MSQTSGAGHAQWAMPLRRVALGSRPVRAGATLHHGIIAVLILLFLLLTSTNVWAAPAAQTEEPLAGVAERIEEIRATRFSFYDDFSSGSGEWSTEAKDGSAIFMRRGAEEDFTIQISGLEARSWSTPTTLDKESLSDYLAEVDTSVVRSDPERILGLIFRYVDDKNFYIFAIRHDEYALILVEDDAWTSLYISEPTAAIDLEPGAVNRLGVLVEGAQITLLINGEVLEQFEDETLSHGSIGLLVATPSGSTEARFDNVTLWALGVSPTALDTDAIAAQLDEIQSEEPTVYDEFRSDEGAWYTGPSEGATYSYGRRAFHLRIHAVDTFTWSNSLIIGDLQPADYLIAVDAEVMDGPDDAEFGLIFDLVDNRNYYAFLLSGGSYRLVRQVAGEWEFVLPWTETEAIEVDTINRLGVLAQDELITLLINDQQVAQVEERTPAAGTVALLVSTGTEGEVEVAFSELEFWLLSTMPSPTAGAAFDFDPDATLARIDEILKEEPAFFDDFRRDTGEWYLPSSDNATFTVRNQAYRIRVHAPNWVEWNLNSEVDNLGLADFLAGVEVELVEGPESSEHGLAFRVVDSKNFYVAWLSQGWFKLQKSVDGEYSDLIGWTESDAIPTEPGRINHLAVLAEGDTITLLINSEPVAQVQDETFDGGGIALIVGTFDEGEVEVAFRDLEIWALATLPSPASEPDDDFDAAAVVTQLAEIRAAEPAYEDDFRLDTGDWYTESSEQATYTYHQRTLRVNILAANYSSWSDNERLAELAPASFLAEVDAEAVSGPADGEYGLMFHLVDEENHYLFSISGGHYQLLRRSDNEPVALIDWRESAAIEVGEVNRLGVLAQGGLITLLVNDIPIAQLADDALAAGGVALYASAFDEGDVEIAFDNFELWTIATVAESAFDAAAIAAQVAEIHRIEPAFYDGFRRDEGSWYATSDEDVTYTYRNRAFHITVHPAEVRIVSGHETITGGDLANYLAEVDVQFVSGPDDGEAGLFFRVQDQQNNYLFLISQDQFTLAKQVEGEWEALVDWTESSAIEAGEVNRLGVLAQDASLTLLINGEPVAQVTDDGFATGGVALAAGARSAGEVEVAFDDLEFWPLTTTPTAAPTELDVEAISAELAAIRQAEPAFSEEFGRDTGGWEVVSNETKEFAYVRRAYQMTLHAPQSVTWSNSEELAGQELRDYLVEVDATLLDGPADAEYGLGFRFVDNGNVYHFKLSNDSYKLVRLAGGEWTELIDWTASAAIDTEPGAVNRLGVLAQGATLTLIVNDTPVAQVEDSAIPAGNIGLVLGTFDEGGTRVAFDNLDLWLLAEDETVAGGETDTDASAVTETRGEEIAGPDEEVDDQAEAIQDAADPLLSFSEWQEPEENAFRTVVPDGWRVTGGLSFEMVPTGRPWLQLGSPDREIVLFIGDGALPLFLEPSPVLETLGYREGGLYSPDGATQFLIRTYQPGEQFAAAYVEDQLDAEACSIAGVRTLPALKQSFERYARTQDDSFGLTHDVGEVTLSCTVEGVAYTGYLYVHTSKIELFDLHSWDVVMLAGFIASSSRTAEALMVLDQAVGQWQYNQTWLVEEAGLPPQTARALAAAVDHFIGGFLTNLRELGDGLE